MWRFVITMPTASSGVAEVRTGGKAGAAEPVSTTDEQQQTAAAAEACHLAAMPLSDGCLGNQALFLFLPMCHHNAVQPDPLERDDRRLEPCFHRCHLQHRVQRQSGDPPHAGSRDVLSRQLQRRQGQLPALCGWQQHRLRWGARYGYPGTGTGQIPGTALWLASCTLSCGAGCGSDTMTMWQAQARH